MFLNVETERLEKWLNNVRNVREEYKKGTHTLRSCPHCEDAVIYRMDGKFRIPEDEKIVVTHHCDACIWVTIEKEWCEAYMAREGNSFTSSFFTHRKDEHIARCNKWLELIQNELERRNKK